jgi:hypothetical protein
MHDLFNKMIMNMILFLKKPNFTIIRTFFIDGNKFTEYIYNSKTYFTDVWPPNTSVRGTPIKSVIRDDGKDVTKMAIKFSGPRRCYIHPLSVCSFRKKLRMKYHNFGVRLYFEDVSEKFKGSYVVTDILGTIKTIEH